MEEDHAMIQRTFDIALCFGVMNEMFDDIFEDNAEPATPDVMNEYWMCVYQDIDLIGIYRLHQLNGITYQIHAMIRPKYRHIKTHGAEILKWCLENLEFEKLVAEIPEIYPNVYHYCKKWSKDEGINRSNFLKNGKIHHSYRLGVTKEELCQAML